jgi:hypothetical protein
MRLKAKDQTQKKTITKDTLIQSRFLRQEILL